jgi:hypothetical protein
MRWLSKQGRFTVDPVRLIRKYYLRFQIRETPYSSAVRRKLENQPVVMIRDVDAVFQKAGRLQNGNQPRQAPSFKGRLASLQGLFSRLSLPLFFRA